MSRRGRFVLSAASALAVSLLMATTSASAAPLALGSGGSRHPLPAIAQLKVIDGQQALERGPGKRVAALPTTTVPKWRHTVSDGGTSYQYAMVGRNPTVAQTTQSVTVPTEVVPLVVKFSNGHTWNPSVGDSCDSTSALARTAASPIFKTKSYSFGGTSVGTSQYVDAFQRANYYKYTSSSGINPGYHVTLGLTMLSPVTISVPNADSAEGTTTCGNGLLGAVEINWLDNYLRTKVIPSLAAQGVGVKTLPLFLLGNVVEYVGTPNDCCVLGFHNAFQTSAGIQTYAVSMYDNTGDFTGSQDVSVLAHEVGEWMDDPLTTNPTRPWGHVGQVSGCQNTLEVGDPLSGKLASVTLSSHVYHVQELAFTSWFYHQATSTGVNGWYSNYGTFKAPAAACS